MKTLDNYSKRLFYPVHFSKLIMASTTTGVQNGVVEQIRKPGYGLNPEDNGMGPEDSYIKHDGRTEDAARRRGAFSAKIPKWGGSSKQKET